MRHDDHRGRAQCGEVGADQRLAFRVERAGGLVEDQDPRIVDQRARDGEALLLAAGQIGRAFLDVGFISVRHALDEFLGAREPCRAHRILEREAGPAGEDVFANRAAEQEVVLQHDTEALPQMAQVDLAQVAAVDLQEARIVAVDALQQAGDGRFPEPERPTMPHYRLGPECDAVSAPALGAAIREGRIVEADRAVEVAASRRTRHRPERRFSTDAAG